MVELAGPDWLRLASKFCGGRIDAELGLGEFVANRHRLLTALDHGFDVRMPVLPESHKSR